MKLALYLRDDEARQALRYHPLQPDTDLRIFADGASSLQDQNELIALQHFQMAEKSAQNEPMLHVCTGFGILYLPPGSGSIKANLEEILKSHLLYVLKSDSYAQGFLSDYKHREIELLTTFYRQKVPLKILVSSLPEVASCIISSNPEGFLHFILGEKSIKLCLGGEYFDDDPANLRAAVHLAEELCQSWMDPSMIPYAEARKCLIDGSGSYGFFADRYDSYMAHVDYHLWYERIMLWHRIYSKTKLTRILELACGTANVSARFVQAGYEVDACDLSAQMLVNAQSKRYSPNLYQASLTDPIPGREYDLIICLFDSINYLKNLSEISQCLMEAEKALAPHGIFIFDISTLLNSMENFSDMVNHQHDKDTHLIHKAYYEPGQRRQISRLYLFKAQGAAYSLQTEEHHQRVFLTEELAKVIEDSPLKLLAIHSTDSKTNFYPKKLSGLDHRHYRLFFILGRA